MGGRDELKISQVVYNLVNNAITYSGQDKTITLRQTVEEGKVRVSVTDTGEGIPQDKLKDIWERYYKVDKEHKRAQMGSGLGLSIVKNILDMHGGTYGVTSTLGQGSTFWFELPVAQQSPESCPAPRTEVYFLFRRCWARTRARLPHSGVPPLSLRAMERRLNAALAGDAAARPRRWFC